jgi:hypothetical protein
MFSPAPQINNKFITLQRRNTLVKVIKSMQKHLPSALSARILMMPG